MSTLCITVASSRSVTNTNLYYTCVTVCIVLVYAWHKISSNLHVQYIHEQPNSHIYTVYGWIFT